MFDYYSYTNLLGQLESSSNYKAKNSIGALGKYQFMPSTLNALKNLYQLPDWKNAEYFLNNPSLQETYENYHIADGLAFINANNLKQYLGKDIKGGKRFKTVFAKINIYGLLAGIHLAGGGNLKKFLEQGKDYDDGKTAISDYIAYFSKNIIDFNLDPKSLALAFIPAIVLYYL